MAVPVQAPTRRPRQGGIKSVAPFVDTPDILRANAAGGLAWEDSGCGLPKTTRAGCYDDVVPAGGTNEVQRLTVTGTPTGGTFRLTFQGEETAPIAYNANAAAVQAALEALGNIVPGDVTVGGGALPGSFVTFTFGGRYATRSVDQMTVNAAFTGGTAPAAAVTTTTPGVAPKTTDGPEMYTTIGDPFARYAGVECFLGGDSIGPEYLEQANTLLEQGEDRAVEAVLWDWAELAASPGSAEGAVAAIGKAEQYADGVYVGAPVLLMSRSTAALAASAGVLKWDGERLVTTNGNWVISTGTADEDMVIAIGAVAVYASTTISRQAADLHHNVDMAIAERVYAIGVDCSFRYAVTITAP